MKNFRLVTPNISHDAAAIEFMKEIIDLPAYLYGTGGLENYFRDDHYPEWLEVLEKERNRKADLDTVPNETFFLVGTASDDTERIVGICNIEYGLHERLWTHGQHLSLTVRPSERGHGYAKLMLYLMTYECSKHGMNTAIVSCNADDVVVPRILRANGGKLIGCYNDTTYNRRVQKYVIPVNDTARDYRSVYNALIAR